ncbi:20518_t:CDS:1, partial [Cetraspora pellucida]
MNEVYDIHSILLINVAYDAQQVSNGQSETPNFGTVVKGRPQPSSQDQLGLLTYVTNYTGLQLFINPSSPNLSYYTDLSCLQEPKLRCYQKKNPPFQTKDLLCLSVVNPHDKEMKFSLSVSFTSGIDPISTTPSPLNPGYSVVATVNNAKPTATHSGSPNFIASGSDVGGGGTGVWLVLVGVGVA